MGKYTLDFVTPVKRRKVITLNDTGFSVRTVRSLLLKSFDPRSSSSKKSCVPKASGSSTWRSTMPLRMHELIVLGAVGAVVLMMVSLRSVRAELGPTSNGFVVKLAEPY